MTKSDYEDFLTSMKEYNLLNPFITFSGDIQLSNCNEDIYSEKNDILYLNSLTDKYGLNLYGKFLNDKFYNVLLNEEEQFKFRKILYPLIITTLDQNVKGRRLKFSHSHSLKNILSSYEVDISDLTEEQLVTFAKKFFKNERKELIDIQDKEKASPFYHKQKSYFESKGIPFSVTTIKKNISIYSSIIKVISNINQNMKKTYIKEEEFLSCFSYDKFLLIYAKCCLDNSRLAIESNNELPAFFIQLDQLITNYYMNEAEGFNPSIKYYDSLCAKIKTYTFKDFLGDYHDFKKEHQSKKYPIDEPEFAGANVFNDLQTSKILASILNTDEVEYIEANWSIIAPEKKEKSLDILNSSISSIKKQVLNKNKNKELIKDTIYYQFVLESTNYAIKIVGKDKFKGFVGYIYQDGKVLFEKFYENSRTEKAAKSNATFIMNIKNFAKFCKLNKQQIIAFISDNENEKINRKFHSRNWEIVINRIVNDLFYQKQLEEMIDELLEAKFRREETKKGDEQDD